MYPVGANVAREQCSPRDDVLLGVGSVEEVAGFWEMAASDVARDESGPSDDVSVRSSVEQLAGLEDFALAAEFGYLEVGAGDGGVEAGVEMDGGDYWGGICGERAEGGREELEERR